MANEKKFLDQAGVEFLWSKINMQDYPNNETLMAVITAIDETKADKRGTNPYTLWDYNTSAGQENYTPITSDNFTELITESLEFNDIGTIGVLKSKDTIIEYGYITTQQEEGSSGEQIPSWYGNNFSYSQKNWHYIGTESFDDLSFIIYPIINKVSLPEDIAYINTEDNENVENPDIVASDITIDSTLSTTSTNPVQNQAITKEINFLLNAKESGELNGKDGLTPYIGDNGNWFTGETDTGIPASINITAQGMTDNCYIAPTTEYNIDTTALVVFLKDESQNKFRGLPVNYIDLYFTKIGTVKIIKDKAISEKIGTTEESYTSYTLITEFTATQIGWNRCLLNPTIILESDEYLGTYDEDLVLGFHSRGSTSDEALPLYYYGGDGNTRWGQVGNNFDWFIRVGFYGSDIISLANVMNNIHSPYKMLAGKRFSIVGDSISTFQGYIPSGYSDWYPNGNVTDVSYMWWNKLATETGMTLLKNCSSGGSTVHGDSTSITNAAAGCSTKRINDLAEGAATPDIVFCFMGINDFTYGGYDTPIGSWNSTKEIPSEGTIMTFSESYAIMVDKIMKTYPRCRVFCCTFMQCTGFNKDAVNPGVYPTMNSSNIALEQYNAVIRDVAHGLGADVIELTSCGINYHNYDEYTTDDLHPNIEGQELIMKKVLSALLANY